MQAQKNPTQGSTKMQLIYFSGNLTQYTNDDVFYDEQLILLFSEDNSYVHFYGFNFQQFAWITDLYKLRGNDVYKDSLGCKRYKKGLPFN